MKNFLGNKNLIVSIVVIVILLVGGYYYFGSSSSDSSAILSSDTTTSNDSLLSTLNQLKSLSLDASIFSEPAFIALTDNTVILPTVPSGRPNPFAPLAGLVPITTTQAGVSGLTH